MNKLFWVASGLLLLAVFNLPIGYYTFLRIMVSIAAGYAIYNEYKGDMLSHFKKSSFKYN